MRSRELAPELITIHIITTPMEQNQHTHIKENEKELVLRESQCIFWLFEDAMK